jgi:hypothetical protein
MLAGNNPGMGIRVADVNCIVTVEAWFPSGPVAAVAVKEIGLGLTQVVAPERLILLVNWS